MNGYDVVTDLLTTEEAERVYHRFPELREGICPTCRGAGFYRGRVAEVPCDCMYQIALAKRYTAAGIGRIFQRLDWTDFAGDPAAIADIRRYLDNYEAYVDRGVGLLIWGTAGTGKTMLANLVLKDLVKKGVRCYATLFSDTIEAFTRTWGNPAEKQWFADTFMFSTVLLLDDLGKEMRTHNNLPQSTFDSILRNRVHDSRPTIVTTNMTTANELARGYGAGVLSLIKGSALVIEPQGEDFRFTSSERTLDEIDAGARRPIV